LAAPSRSCVRCLGGGLVDTGRFLDLDSASAIREYRRVAPGIILTNPDAFLYNREIAVGNLKNRSQILQSLRDLPTAVVVSDSEVLDFIERFLLAGRGLSYIDVHLLAAARVSEAPIRTPDRRLQTSGELLSLSAKP